MNRKPTVGSILKRVEDCKTKIAAERDKLRDLIGKVITDITVVQLDIDEDGELIE